MGRPSKLTDREWAEIGRRLSEGESQASLARKFKVSRAIIIERFSDRVSDIREAGKALADAELMVERLPVVDRMSARSLADQMKSAAGYLAQAAVNGAKTAAIMSGHAASRAEAKGFDPSDPEAVRQIAALSATSTEASKIPVNLLNVKTKPTDEDSPAGKPKTTLIVNGVVKV